MRNQDIYIIRYCNPALSYLPKIGSMLHEIMQNYHNNLIQFCDIDRFVTELKVEQETILRQNPRLKPISIRKHDWDTSIRIDTPVKNQDPEELFIIEPIQGYMYELSSDLNRE